MRFVVPKDEFEETFEPADSFSDVFGLSAKTSVHTLQVQFYEGLSKVGEIIQLDFEKDLDELRQLSKKKDVIVAGFYQQPPQGVPCRFLYPSKGSLLLPGGFLNKWNFGKSTYNLITSSKQSWRLKLHLKEAAPNMIVFPPNLNTDIFRLPMQLERDKAREKFKIKPNQFHIVYAGRFIANKGLVQLIRACNLLSNKATVKITLVGSFERDFLNYQSNTTNYTFPAFFKREIIDKSKVDIEVLEAMSHEELNEFYWSADCFVYPSFHEDENFGIAPREAILCGMPVIVSDFCGLSALGHTRGGLLKTFPSLGGVRFSVFQLANELQRIRMGLLNAYTTIKQQEADANWVKNECDQEYALENLKEGVEKLLNLEPYESIGGWRSKERTEQWLMKTPRKIQEAFQLPVSEPKKGLYVDGSGNYNKHFSEEKFLTAIQSFYTTMDTVPDIMTNTIYFGFWRINLWEDEKSLVEFGFPGPRVKKFSLNEWNNIKHCLVYRNNELGFMPKTLSETDVIKELVELGYLVPETF